MVLCHSDIGIPISKTLVIWASHVTLTPTLTLTLTQIAKVIREGDVHITTRGLGMGCPKRWDTHINVTAAFAILDFWKSLGENLHSPFTHFP